MEAAHVSVHQGWDGGIDFVARVAIWTAIAIVLLCLGAVCVISIFH